MKAQTPSLRPCHNITYLISLLLAITGRVKPNSWAYSLESFIEFTPPSFLNLSLALGASQVEFWWFRLGGLSAVLQALPLSGFPLDSLCSSIVLLTFAFFIYLPPACSLTYTVQERRESHTYQPTPATFLLHTKVSLLKCKTIPSKVLHPLHNVTISNCFCLPLLTMLKELQSQTLCHLDIFVL